MRKIKSPPRSRAWLMSLLLAGLLGGCGEPEHEDLRVWMKDATRDLRGRIPPLPQVKPHEPVSYDAEHLPDPFKSSKIAAETRRSASNQPDMTRPREPLEAMPLESLNYVGMLRKKSVTNAIIQTDGTLYRVRVGNYLGQNFGVITTIDENEVSLRELVADAAGDWVERTSTLRLQEGAKKEIAK